MKHITFYFDVISPYAYLAFEHLPVALMGNSYSVTYQPILFAGALNHHGQLGPAEIPPKRDWTYRQILWLARELSIPLQFPAAHPFNPLALQRFAVAVSKLGTPNRITVERLFHHVWRNGLAADDGGRLQALIDAQPSAYLKSKLDAQLYRFGTQPHFCIAYVIGCIKNFLSDGR